MNTLQELLATGEYLSYAYAYPHKTTYRTLSPAVRLSEAWAGEDRQSLFLYLHVPFCEQRCGFCNLYTQVQPKDGVAARYLAAVERQAAVVREALARATATGEALLRRVAAEETRFVRLAIGGGTPTFLGASLLDRLFGVAEGMGARRVPTSVEVSPGTLDEEQLSVLSSRGVTRASIGVQSIFSEETGAVQRGQVLATVERAVRGLVERLPIINVDLIYGLPGQTKTTLLASIDHVLGLGANEIYLYPLYVRPLTALGRADARAFATAGPRDGVGSHAGAGRGVAAPEDKRLGLYRAGRDHLRGRGWKQHSMRMFRAPGAPGEGSAPGAGSALDGGGAPYRCQEDGMVGLGAGARSYTRALHYANPYAVAQSAIRTGIEAWMAQTDADFGLARHGIHLGIEEQRRRFLLLSLLDTGLDRAAYLARFGEDVLAHFPDLLEAAEAGLLVVGPDTLGLGEAGLERADVFGHWLQSPAVRAAREAWTPA